MVDKGGLYIVGVTKGYSECVVIFDTQTGEIEADYGPKLDMYVGQEVEIWYAGKTQLRGKVVKEGEGFYVRN